MDSPLFRILAIGGLFVLIILLGYGLKFTGKPYNPVLFNVHKLIAVITTVWLILIARSVHLGAGIDQAGWILIGLGAFFLLTAIVTGGLLSVEHSMQSWVGITHHLLPYTSAALWIAALARILYPGS